MVFQAQLSQAVTAFKYQSNNSWVNTVVECIRLQNQNCITPVNNQVTNGVRPQSVQAGSW